MEDRSMINAADTVRGVEETFCRDNERAITEVRNRLRASATAVRRPAGSPISPKRGGH